MCREGVEQSRHEKLHAGDQGSGDIWQLYPACGYEGGWYMQTGPQGGQRLGAVVGCGNAREQWQLMLMEMVLGCQPPPGYSLGQVRKLSGRLLPLAVRALATAPGILGMVPQGPAPGKSPEWGRSGLAPMPPRR